MNQSKTKHFVNGRQYEVVYTDNDSTIEVTLETAVFILAREKCTTPLAGAKVARGARLVFEALANESRGG